MARDILILTIAVVFLISIIAITISRFLPFSGYDLVQHGERGVQSAPEQHLHQLERGKKFFLGEILRQLLLS